MWRRVLASVVTASLAVSAWAHGYMSVPVSRNMGASDCPHCLNAGGVGEVYATGSWPNGKHGVCGDPASSDRPHEGGGKYEQAVGIRVTHYNAGDTIVVKGKLTANHLGYMQHFLCVLPANSAGGSGERQHLTNECFKRGGPLKVQQDGAWSDRFYVSSSLSDFQYPLRLPATECARCVLRWYYLSGNSCTPPGTPAKWASSGLVPCGGGGANPEEFWNCADVALLKKGAALPPPSKLKPRGELSTGQSAPSNATAGADAGPPLIEDTENDVVIGDDEDGAPAAAWGGDGGTDLVTFENVAVSVIVGTGVGLPALLLSPALGSALGLFAFAIAIAFFILQNRPKEGFRVFLSRR